MTMMSQLEIADVRSSNLMARPKTLNCPCCNTEQACKPVYISCKEVALDHCAKSQTSTPSSKPANQYALKYVLCTELGAIFTALYTERTGSSLATKREVQSI